MSLKTSFEQFCMPAWLWKHLRRLLPKYPKPPLGGRPRTPLRDAADAIYFRLRTGCQWKAIPFMMCSGSTAHAYYQEWAKRGVFGRLWKKALRLYDRRVGIDWRWQSLDGAMTKAPLGGEKTGRNPTDRGKLGVKRSLLTDAVGVPIGLAVAGANVVDFKLLKATMASRDCVAPKHAARHEQHLCLDKGYDYPLVHQWLKRQRRYTPHLRTRGEEKRELNRADGERPRRWVVERSHSFLNRWRAILVRWDKKLINHRAGLELACAYHTLSLAEVLG